MRTLRGSCHCGAVRFSVGTHTLVPYMRCYCSICRKSAGGGGYAINLMGEAETLTVEGMEHVTAYVVRRSADPDAHTGDAQRHFCRHCGSALWGSDKRWAQWVYPFASAIDSDLPAPEDRVHIMLGSKANWVAVPEAGSHDARFEEYPDRSVADWHKDHGVWEA